MIICFFIECICAATAPICILFAFIVGAFMLGIMHATFKTNRIIADLKEQKGEPVTPATGSSPFLTAGLLLNAIALLSEPLPDIIEFPLRILAIALMVYGIIKTASQNKI